MSTAFVALAAGVLGLTTALVSGGVAHADAPTFEVTGLLTGVPTAASSPLALGGVHVWVVGSDSERYAGTTDENGAFDISFTPADGGADPSVTYTMLYNCADADDTGCDLGYTLEWSGHAYTRADAPQFALTAASPIATRDFELQGASTVTGVVRDWNGVSIEGAHVSVSAPNVADASRGESSETNSSGMYTINQVRPGDTQARVTYSAGVDGQGHREFYRAQYWNHADAAGDATPLVLQGGATTSDIDFDLVQAPAIRGRVVDAAGNGLPDIAYFPMHWDAVANTWVAERTGTFDTDANGYLNWNASSASSWKFSFADLLGADDGNPQAREPYQSAWYDGASSFSSSSPIDTSGESTQVDLGAIELSPQTGPINVVGSPVISSSPANDGGVILNGLSVSPGDATVALQWLRDGAAITGATSSEYLPVSADQGSVLSVHLLATRSGYADQTFESQPLDLRSNFTATPTPTITGAASVGSTLTVDPGTWAPTPDSFSYQWSRGGTPISGATSSTYPLVAADAGATITATVTGTKAGYVDTTVTSAPTDTVAPGTLTVGTPTIIGSPTYGQPLTASPGTWGPGTVAFSYQWISGTTDIAGATSQTYTPVLGDVGSKLSVRVSGSQPGYTTAVATSAQSGNVATRGFSAAPTPTITGTVAVGQTVTAIPGAWAPGTPTFAYQWLSEGTPITGATSSTYAIIPADQNNRLSVVVTGSEPGYTDTPSTSVQTAPVAFGTLSPGGPSITPTAPTYGQTLTAVTGTWDPSPVVFSYQWQRNSADISGATSSTYPLVPADVGARISVKVTGSKPGYTNATSTSSQTSTVSPGVLTPGTPTISGNYVFESTLTASPGTWAPSGVTFVYQWLRGGVAIGGATSSTYALVAADVGSTVSVRVTGSLAGYTSAASSAAGSLVAAKTFDTTVTPTLTGPSVNHVITASTTGWVPSTDSFSYAWYRDGVAVTGIANSNKYNLTPSDFGKTITVIQTGVKAGYTSVTSPLSNGIGPIATFLPRFTNSAPPTISGDTTVGESLTATTGTWSPAPDSYTYVWQRGTGDPTASPNGYVPIQDATSATYRLQAADFGKSIVVRVTAVKAGYDTSGATSASGVTDPVSAGTLASSKPSILGTATYGSTLTVDPGAWSPTPTFGYQWLRGGSAINGATSKTYALQVADVGQAISVRVTGTSTGYDTSVQDSSATSLVNPGTFATPLARPGIEGAAQVGRVLAAIDPGFSPATPFSHQWYRSGAPIVGAVGAFYAVAAADEGETISVRVTSTLPGYQVTSSTSDETATVVQGVFTTTPRPTITGSARVGSTLTANHGTWVPAISDFTYLWRTGNSIIGTGATYVPTASLIGKTITVVVTSAADGFATQSSPFSTATARVVAGAIGAHTPTVTGSPRVGQLLSVTLAADWTPATTKLSYRWLRAGKAISGATRSTYTAGTADYRKALSVQVIGSLSGYTTVSKVSRAVTIGSGVLTVATPTISGLTPSGQPVVGTTLTAVRGTWGPGTVTIRYQWYLAGTAISGATRSTYTPSSGTKGKTIAVRVTGSKTDFTTVSRTSAPTATVIAGTITNVSAPGVTGSGAIGTHFIATAGRWSTSSQVTYTYQWFRHSADPTVADVAIPGAVKNYHTVSSADVGFVLVVVVTAARPGFTTASADAAANSSVSAD